MAAVESSTEVVARAAMQPRVINRTSAGSNKKMWESELIIFAIPWPTRSGPKIPAAGKLKIGFFGIYGFIEPDLKTHC